MSDVKPNLRKFLTVLVEPVQDLENAIAQVRLSRNVNTATGHALTLLGKLVGQDRDGLEDEPFRRLVRARIRVNRSLGTVEDAIAIARLVIDDTNARIVIEQHSIATLIVRVLDADPAITTIAESLVSFLQAGAAAGVRVILEYPHAPDAGTFRFAGGGAGLGFAGFARLDLVGPFSITDSIDTVIGSATPDGSFADDGVNITISPGGSGAGQLLEGGYPDIEFAYEDGVTTVADFEAAVAASKYLRVIEPGTAAELFEDTDDNASNVPFVGSFTGGQSASAADVHNEGGAFGFGELG